MRLRYWLSMCITLLLVVLPVKVAAEATEGVLLSAALITSELQKPAFSTTEYKPEGQFFGGLSDAILFYEELQESGLWQVLAEGPLLKQGMMHSQILILRQQLWLLGDLAPNSPLPLLAQQFDAELQAALKRFQARHSLKADGIAGPQTRAALNVPPWQRIDQLVLNIHRQQQPWIDSVQPYVQVNLPEYRLRLYQQGEITLQMKAIIGKNSRQTPVFSASVRQVVVNPDWNVPKTIALEDIVPRWQQDRDYLQKHNLWVLAGWETPRVSVPENEVEFSRLYHGKNYLRFWEPPGENNTLGKVKFPLTSDNSIYLHDTRGRHLFDAEKRTFSSGCIRLERPRDLANALIMLSNQWRPQLLDPLFEARETIPVRLRNPVPVHITYWTAWLDKRGELNFADDPYQLDAIDFAQLQRARQQQQNQSVDQPETQIPAQVNMHRN